MIIEFNKLMFGGCLMREAGGEVRLLRFLKPGDPGEGSFTYAPFHPEERPLRVGFAWDDPALVHPGLVFSFCPRLIREPLLTQSQYLDLVEQTIRFAGEHNGKVVIARQTYRETEGAAPLEAFHNLCERYPELNIHLIFHPKTGVWLGATPEVLVQYKGSSFASMSLAGTRSPEGDPFTFKEKHEQALVTDDLLERYRNLGADQLEHGPLEEIQAGPVMHLLTWVKAELQAKPEEVIRALHPTPAVCGTPRRKALEFILAHEGLNRRYYSGYFGYSEGDRGRYFVNLRCGSIFQKGVALYAGGGITKDSVPDLEWNETRRKLATLEGVLFT